MKVYFLQITYADDYTVLLDITNDLIVLRGDEYHEKITGMIEGFFFAYDYATEFQYNVVEIDRTDTEYNEAIELGLFS